MNEGRGEENEDSEEKDTEWEGHKIIKRQKAMTACTFKPNSLIMGPCQGSTFVHIVYSTP